ncbi:hypothetical protein ACUN0G_12010 [Pseudomonas sp. 32A]|uniref:hypothetical protein n=1 Tax=Pseudomonas sp. 32A TaxID=651185 RepID=UPI0040465055
MPNIYNFDQAVLGRQINKIQKCIAQMEHEADVLKGCGLNELAEAVGEQIEKLKVAVEDLKGVMPTLGSSR